MAYDRAVGGRRAVPLVPKKTIVNDDVQWAVRVPISPRKQERAHRYRRVRVREHGDLGLKTKTNGCAGMGKRACDGHGPEKDGKRSDERFKRKVAPLVGKPGATQD